MEDNKAKKGMLSKLKFWADDDEKSEMEYLISLISEGSTTDLVILNKQGKLDNGDTAGRIINLLYEQLN